MKLSNPVLILLTLLSIPLVSASAQSSFTTVTWRNFTASTLLDNSGAALSAGTSADGDGAILQLGYYNRASTSNNFLGTFIPLTGLGSANTDYTSTSVGDTGGGPNGRFAITEGFFVGTTGSGQNLPATGTPLAVAFYNGRSTTSGFYNVVSNDSWLWVAPTTDGSATVTVSLGSSGSATADEFLSGGSVYRTTIALVPEPSTWVMLICGVCALAGYRHLNRTRLNS